MQTHPPKLAVIAGATGLVGSQLLPLLCAAPEYGRVLALLRRPLGFPHTKLDKLEARQIRFDALIASLQGEQVEAGTLDVFCCLGTTIRSAGSEEAFQRVDFDYVLSLAHWAQQQQARSFLVISALGADRKSSVFYNRVKGEMEQALRALPLPVCVLRPSLLDGSRTELRWGERLALLLTRPIRGLLPASVRPVQAADVAASMLNAARTEPLPALVVSAQMQGAARALETAA